MINESGFLKQSSLFSSLNPEELNKVLGLMKRRTYQPGDTIIHQDTLGKEMFVLTQGSVEVLKQHNDADYRLAILHPVDIFGELALIDEQLRSTSVRALEPTTLLSLSVADFTSLQSEPELHQKISQNLMIKLSKRLRKSNDVTTEALERELVKTKSQLITGNFMVGILITLTLFTFLLESMASLTKLLGTAAVITTPVMLLLFGMFMFGIKKSGNPLSFYGFTLHHWQKVAWQAFIYTLPVLGIITLAKWLAITYIPTYASSDLFSLGKNAVQNTSASPWVIGLMLFSYVFISSPIQEILFRGGLQSTLQFFLLGKYRYFLAIFTSNLIFAMIHLVLSPLLAVVTFVIGLFWGLMYKKQASLVGVILSHILIGFWSFFILGMPQASSLTKVVLT